MTAITGHIRRKTRIRMNIVVNEETAVNSELMETLKKAASACIDTDVEISLSFVSLDEIHELNREYRGVDSPTDVLSFPMYDDPEEIQEGDLLGDVVICMDKVIAQAEEYGHSRERETVYLFTHSVLHLLGYDHMTEEDKKEMRSREEEVMAQLNLTREETH